MDFDLLNSGTLLFEFSSTLVVVRTFLKMFLYTFFYIKVASLFNVITHSYVYSNTIRTRLRSEELIEYKSTLIDHISFNDKPSYLLKKKYIFTLNTIFFELGIDNNKQRTKQQTP